MVIGIQTMIKIKSAPVYKGKENFDFYGCRVDATQTAGC
jgi:hypothetical protein